MEACVIRQRLAKSGTKENLWILDGDLYSQPLAPSHFTEKSLAIGVVGSFGNGGDEVAGGAVFAGSDVVD